MGESRAWRCPYAIQHYMIHLCHILTKQKDPQHQCQWLLFHASFHMQAFLFTPLPCWSRLRGSPQSSIEEFAFTIWCASPAQYTCILLHRSKASEEFIKRNYSKKERGEEDQDIRDVALNKLDGYPILVERTSKGKADATSVKLGENILDSEEDLA